MAGNSHTSTSPLVASSAAKASVSVRSTQAFCRLASGRSAAILADEQPAVRALVESPLALARKLVALQA